MSIGPFSLQRLSLLTKLGFFAYPPEMVYFTIYRSFEPIIEQVFYLGLAKGMLARRLKASKNTQIGKSVDNCPFGQRICALLGLFPVKFLEYTFSGGYAKNPNMPHAQNTRLSAPKSIQLI